MSQNVKQQKIFLHEDEEEYFQYEDDYARYDDFGAGSGNFGGKRVVHEYSRAGRKHLGKTKKTNNKHELIKNAKSVAAK
eukprot:m.38933 g.38933  ORF g.38933 m.38933 type:complete len:79 (-) comp9493_c1_seq1:1581-1817(-)